MTTTSHIPTSRDINGIDWFKSSYSDNGLACVEVADLTPTPYGRVAVRDSKESNGPALLIAPEGWTAFVTAVTHCNGHVHQR